MRRIAITLATVVAVLLVGTVIGVVAAIRKPIPDTSGAVQLPGLDGTVTVSRDRYGIPTVTAETADDLFFAEGYVHAQDRFHEMDVRRHVARGTFRVLVGGSGRGVDHLTKALDLRSAARREQARLPAASRSALDAYARGVNAYIVGKPGSALSFEYAAKSLIRRDYRPAPWTSLDSVGWSGLLDWDLGGPMTDEIDRVLIARHMPVARVADLYPGAEMADSVAARGSAWLTSPDDAPMLLRLRDAANDIPRVTGLATAAGTSAWIARPKAGREGPVLEANVATSISLPSPWYQIGLRCVRVTRTCPYDVTGLSLAGMPGVVVGHNRTVGWGFGYRLPSTARLSVVAPKRKSKDAVVGTLSNGAKVTVRHEPVAKHSNVTGVLALDRAADAGDVRDAADDVSLPFSLVYADATGKTGEMPKAAEPQVPPSKRSPLADLLVPSLLPLKVSTRFADQGKMTLLTWDRTMSGSPAAAYFAAVWRNVLALTFHDELPRAQWPDGGARWTVVMRRLLATPNATWWDNLATPTVRERRDDILRQAMEDARGELTMIRAREVKQWNWADLHAASLRNPTLAGRLFQRGPVPLTGSEDTVEATAWDAAAGYAAVTAPAARLVMDLGAPDRSRWVVATGASGHTFAAHYTDQVEPWRTGKNLAWPFSASAVDKAADRRLTLASPTR